MESGFAAVSTYLEKKYAVSQSDTYSTMLSIWEQDGRGAVFDRTLDSLNIPYTKKDILGLVDLYRHHRPEINLYPKVQERLRALAMEYDLALVTNGLALMQKRKVEALEILPYFKRVIYADDHQPKPAPSALNVAMNLLGVTPDKTCMIGDNPLTDGAAAKAAGVKFIRIKSDRFFHIAHTGPSAVSFDEACELLVSSV